MACRVVGVARSTAYLHRDRYPELRAAWDEIDDENLARLDESALRRATRGSLVTRMDKEGNVVSTERRHETALTIFMLQKRLAARYGDAPPPSPAANDIDAWRAAAATVPKPPEAK